MPLVELNGIKINYEEHGSPSGTPILLTHAYAATLQMWAPQFEAWPEHRLIVWDMRGHGQSAYPGDASAYSEALTVADMAALLDAVGAGANPTRLSREVVRRATGKAAAGSNGLRAGGRTVPPPPAPPAARLDPPRLRPPIRRRPADK